MSKLTELLDAGELHYFVTFTTFRHDMDGVMKWLPAQAVINRHPFQFIRDQRAPTFAILTGYQQITSEEYELYSKTFNHD